MSRAGVLFAVAVVVVGPALVGLAWGQSAPWFCHEHGYASVRDCGGACLTNAQCFEQANVVPGQQEGDWVYDSCLSFLGDGFCEAALPDSSLDLNCPHLADESGDCDGAATPVADPEDTYSPDLLAVRMVNASIDVTFHDQEVVVEVDFEDDLSGVAIAQVTFRTDFNDCDNFLTTATVADSLVSGGANRGTLRVGVVFPSRTISGNWTVCSVRVVDNNLNAATFSLSGGDTQLDIPPVLVYNDGTNLCSPGNGVSRFQNLTAAQGQLTDGSGLVTNYVNNMRCSFLIAPAAHHDFVQLALDYFSLEVSPILTDVVRIYDGEDATAPLLYTLRGSSSGVPKTICSTGKYLFATFSSDGSSVADGFSFQYYARTVGDGLECCGNFDFSAVSGVIGDGSTTSAAYTANKECTFNIVPATQVNFISLEFEYVDLDSESRVTLYSTEEGSAVEAVVAEYTGLLPTFFVCKANVSAMRVVFVAGDNTQSRSGFRVQYEAGLDDNEPCSGTLCQGLQTFTDPTGTVSDSSSFQDQQTYNPHSNCGFLIAPTGGPYDFIHVHITAVDLGKGDFVEVYDGSSSSSQSLAALGSHSSGVSVTDVYVCSSQGSAVFVRFTSDEADQGQGFELQYTAGTSTMRDVAAASLRSLFNATRGHDWKFRTGWGTAGTNDSVCGWYGVACECGVKGNAAELEFDMHASLVTTYVTELQLLDNRLDGTLPSQLFALTSLRSLVLSSNDLSGPLPSEIGALRWFKVLDVSENALSGTIPAEVVAGETQGRFVVLSSNALSGTLPAAVLTSSALASLDVQSNRLSGTLPHALSAALPALSCQDNFLYGNTTNTAGTTLQCSPHRTVVCGDGVRSMDDACAGEGKACCAARTAGEGCDDGGAQSGDGCSSTCGVEPGWWCLESSTLRSQCFPVSCVVNSAASSVVDGVVHSAECGAVNTLCAAQGHPCTLVFGSLQTAVESRVCSAITAQQASVEGGLVVDYPLTIQSASSARVTIVVTSGRFATIASGGELSLSHVAITNAQSQQGGAFYVQAGGRLALTDFLLASNSATEAGGAVYAETGAAVELTRGELFRNTASRGSAVFAEPDATAVVLTDVLVQDDSESSILHCVGSRIVLTNTTFACEGASSPFMLGREGSAVLSSVSTQSCEIHVNSNTGSDSSGLGTPTSPLRTLRPLKYILIAGLEVVLSGEVSTGGEVFVVDQTSNVQFFAADAEAGASLVGADEGTLLVVDSRDIEFSNVHISQASANASHTFGGVGLAAGITAIRSTVRLVGNTLSRSVSRAGGGCVSVVDHSVVRMEGVVFDRCESWVGGGAVHVADGGVVDMTQCRVVNCTGWTEGGGGLFLGQGTVATLEDTDLEHCTATCDALSPTTVCSRSKGGAVRCDGCQLSVTRGTVASNTAANNGGAIVAQVSEGALAHVATTGVRFHNNTAGGRGGAVVCDGFALVAADWESSGDEFAGNRASTTGGAVDVGSGCGAVVRGAWANGNEAATGGAVSVAGGSLVLAANEAGLCSFEANSAVTGGAVYLSSGTATVTQCSFATNQASFGGGVAMVGARLVGSSNHFANNTAQDAGGVHVTGGGVWYETGSRFEGNTATLGGAVFLDPSPSFSLDGQTVHSDFHIYDCDFVENSATTGGAILAEDAGAMVFNTTRFTRNQAGTGGALWVQQHDGSVVHGCQFDSNQALAGDAGALGVFGASTVVQGATAFTNNRCSGNGGAIGVFFGSLTLNHTTIAHNTASSGGGVFGIRASTVIHHTAVHANSAAVGGGLYAVLCETTALSANFSENTATDGGGLYVFDETATATVSHSLFVANRADTGGAIHNNNADLHIDHVLFDDNIGTFGGAGVFSEDSALTLTHVTAHDNRIRADQGDAAATVAGGAVVQAAGGSLVVRNANMSDNSVASTSGVLVGQGGAIFADAVTVLVADSVFARNTARTGGAVSHSFSTGEYSNVEMSNNEASTGGALAVSELSSILVEGSRFDANTAVGSAGAVMLRSVASANLTDCHFTNNVVRVENKAADFAGMGGALLLATVANITMAQSSFTGNRARHGGGGAVFIDFSTDAPPLTAEEINAVCSNNEAMFGSNVATQAYSLATRDSDTTQLSVVTGQTLSTPLVVVVVDFWGSVVGTDNNTLVEVSDEVNSVFGQSVARSAQGVVTFTDVGIDGKAGHPTTLVFSSAGLKRAELTVFVEHQTEKFTQGESVIVLAIVGLALTAITLVIVVVHRNADPIRYASFVFCAITIVGSLVGLSGLIAFSLEPTTFLCCYTLSSVLVGFSMLYSALSLKTYRIWRFFTNKRLRRITITNADLLKALSVPLSVNVALLVVICVIDTPSPTFVDNDVSGLKYKTCDFNLSSPLIVLLLALNGLMMFTALFFAVQSRHAESKFNDSKTITFSIYNVTTISLMLLMFVVSLTSYSSWKARHLLLALGGFFIFAGSVLILFVPKLAALYAANALFSSNSMVSGIKKRLRRSKDMRHGGDGGGDGGGGASAVNHEMINYGGHAAQVVSTSGLETPPGSGKVASSAASVSQAAAAGHAGSLVKPRDEQAAN